MPIKDRISPELKGEMSESIEKTEKSGNERGFFICKDKDGKLSASKIKCEGDSCEMRPTISPRICPDKKIQGFFHVHPQIALAEKQLGKRPTKDDIKNLILLDKKGNRVTIQSPSHPDVLSILITKCKGDTEGTICTAGDLEPDKVECWTPKKGAANLITCSYAKRDPKEKHIAPKTWIKFLFNKEIIDLKKEK